MLSLFAPAALGSTKDYASLFGAWKLTHRRSYASGAAEAEAFKQFAHNEDVVTEHNAKGLSYTLGHNEFSDMGSEEFFSTRLGYNLAAARQNTWSKNPVHEYRGEALPDAIDWVAKGAVSPVKNQGHCGSCWAFSTTGSLEGALAIATGKMTVLSEEELVQCDSVDHGCSGGLMDNAFKFVETNGLTTEATYNYTSGGGASGTCNKKAEAKPVMTITGYTDVKKGDEDALRSAVAAQPVSIAIEADKASFQLYRSGVLDSTSCGTKLDHGVLLVGYGDEDYSTNQGGLLGFGQTQKKPYWKVKNSWGQTWGESGYIRMVRGKDQCGLASDPSYPTGVKPESSKVA